MKNPNQLDETKKSVRQIKNTPKDLIHGQLNGKKPLETRETEMSNPVVTGGSGEQSKTIMIKEEDLQALFPTTAFILSSPLLFPIAPEICVWLPIWVAETFSSKMARLATVET
jgi:hypothetical protein